MIVYVAFKFDGVEPDSERADAIVREITESCETMQIGFDADACWVRVAGETDEGTIVYRQF